MIFVVSGQQPVQGQTQPPDQGFPGIDRAAEALIDFVFAAPEKIRNAIAPYEWTVVGRVLPYLGAPEEAVWAVRTRNYVAFLLATGQALIQTQDGVIIDISKFDAPDIRQAEVALQKKLDDLEKGLAEQVGQRIPPMQYRDP